jgi:long-chain acyl-CoA synthetase
MNAKGSEGDITFSDIVSHSVPEIKNEPEPEQMCAMMFTSGTTGASKIVMYSHKNLTHNAVSGSEDLPADTVIMSVLPIYHIYGYSTDLLISIAFCVTSAINDSPIHLMANLKRFRATTVNAVPVMLQAIYRALLQTQKKYPESSKEEIKNMVVGDSLLWISSGGAYLDPQLIDGLLEFGLPVSQGYGVTECSPRVAGGIALTRRSCGTVLNGMQVKTVGNELWVKGDSVMMGYYKNEEATREAITADGWFKTGDLGYVDEDKKVYVTGRKKNIIILSNGENLSPESIERPFEREPFVSEILVYDEDDEICAEVWPDQEYIRQMKIEDPQSFLEGLGRKINEQFPERMHVTRYKIRKEEFPKTTSKKIRRYDFRH